MLLRLLLQEFAVMRRVGLRIVASRLPGRTCGLHEAIAVGLQEGKAFTQLVDGDAPAATWDTPLELGRHDDGVLLARGPAVHGPRVERFVYLAWLGDLGGERRMFRRAKLQLDGVPADVLDEVLATGRPLVAELGLTDAKGEPVCASVRPPRVRWSVG